MCGTTALDAAPLKTNDPFALNVCIVYPPTLVITPPVPFCAPAYLTITTPEPPYFPGFDCASPAPPPPPPVFAAPAVAKGELPNPPRPPPPSPPKPTPLFP